MLENFIYILNKRKRKIEKNLLIFEEIFMKFQKNIKKILVNV